MRKIMSMYEAPSDLDYYNQFDDIPPRCKYCGEYGATVCDNCIDEESIWDGLIELAERENA